MGELQALGRPSRNDSQGYAELGREGSTTQHPLLFILLADVPPACFPVNTSKPHAGASLGDISASPQWGRLGSSFVVFVLLFDSTLGKWIYNAGNYRNVAREAHV